MELSIPKKEGHSLPQVTEFNNKIKSSVEVANPLKGYFDQSIDERLTINEAIEISWELHQAKLFDSLFSKDKEQYPYYNDSINQWTSFKYHTVLPNYQLSQIMTFFGEEFITSKNVHRDIILTTEQLTEHIKKLSAPNGTLYNWLGKESFEQIQINKTEESFREKNSLNSKNRYLFYIMNQKEYKLWSMYMDSIIPNMDDHLLLRNALGQYVTRCFN